MTVLVESLPASDPSTPHRRSVQDLVGVSPWRVCGSPGEWSLRAASPCATVLIPHSGSCAVSVEGRKPLVLDPRLSLFVPAGHPFRMGPVTRQPAGGRAIRLSNEAVRDFAVIGAEPNGETEIPFVAGIPDLLAILGALNRREANRADSGAGLDVVASIRSAVLASSRSPLACDDRSGRSARRVRTILVDHFAQRLSLTAIGRSLDLSPYYVCHVFRRHFGLSVHQFLLDLRMRAALDLISTGATNFGELSDSLGFSSPSHFASAVRARIGCTPSDLARLLSTTSKTDG